MRIDAHSTKTEQYGAALLIMLAMIAPALLLVFSSILSSQDQANRTIHRNAQVLAQAKAAIIAFAVSTGHGKTCNSAPNCERPGDLPCPDPTPDSQPQANGDPATSCGNAAGSTGQSARLGRLPWKKFNLPDLRDASGQRLWYAVSSNYKNNTRIPVLNSETGFGTITIRDKTGKVTFDGSNPDSQPSGVIAVIIAPGAPILRQDRHQQDHSVNAAREYLDLAIIDGTREDNADFIDKSASNGFIQGPIKDEQGNIVSNDQLVFITYDEIIKPIEQRVASEAIRELSLNSFPRPAGFSDVTCLNVSSSNAITNNSACKSLSSGETCGRIPVNTATATPIWNTTDTLRGGTGNPNTWFQSNLWRELVFYALPGNCNGSSAAQLIVNGEKYKNAIIIVSGRRIPPAQQRQNSSDKTKRSNYLESGNGNSMSYITSQRSNSFNDTVVVQ